MSRDARPHGATRAVGEFLPQRNAFGRRQHHFHTFFAGVAGARHHPLAAFQLLERLHVGARRVMPLTCSKRVDRFGTLHRDHREIAAMLNLHVESGCVLFEPGEHLRASRGVDDCAPAVRAAIHDQVVHHAAFIVQQHAVLGVTRFGEFRGIVCGEVAQIRERTGAVEIDDGHVRNVEHAGVAAHRVVLFDLRAVVQRHFPTAEVDHPRTGRDVSIEERCAL